MCYNASMEIKLDDITWVDGEKNFFTPAQTRNFYGVNRNVNKIILHWFNTPESAGTAKQTMNYLKNAEESIHFVISGKKVYQMTNLANTAFHSLSANPTSVGIEIDPNNIHYPTIGALIRFIRQYYPNAKVFGHNKFVKTRCPGIVSVKKAIRAAKGKLKEVKKKTNKKTNKPAPKPAKTEKKFYRVKNVQGKQVGAFTKERNAWERFLQIGQKGKITSPSGKDVTGKLKQQYQPEPKAPSNEVLQDKVKENTAAIKAHQAEINKLSKTLNKVIDFLQSIFKNF